MKALKNKKSIPVLLVVAVVVWGLIIYRVVVYSGGGKVMTKVAGGRHAISNEEADTLFLNYRDPFLGTVPRIVKQLSPRVREKAIVEEPDSPPGFQFAGRIRKGKRDFWLMKSGNDTRLVSVKEKSVDGYRVERVFRDSVCLRKGKKIYTLKIE